MGTAVIECQPSEETRRLVQEGWAAHDAAVQEHGPADEWDRKVIDQCIRAFALQGRPFSANDLRPLLPQVRVALISKAFIRAQREGLIIPAGYTPSTLPSTKSHPVKVYRPTAAAAAILKGRVSP